MYGIGMAVLGCGLASLGRGWRAWEREPLARWWLGVVFARAAGGLVWYLWAISGLRAFAGRRPALLVERLGVVLCPIAPGADLLWIGSGLFGRR